MHAASTPAGGQARPLYTAEERRRRDASPWTLVQGVLAPIQFVVFLASLGLVLRYLATGEGLAVATASIVVKTLVLYTIMITGSIWEKEVFGRYLFARAFFWEDVFSMLVLALHTAYLAALLTGCARRRASRCCWPSPPMPPTSSTPPSSCSSCARPGSSEPPATDPAAPGTGPMSPRGLESAAATRRSCASAASARSSAA